MFENDNWDVDEDYFKDFNADEILQDFQNEKKEETQESLSKRNNEVKEQTNVNTSRFEFNCNAFENSLSNKAGSHQTIDATSRKNAVLNIFSNKNEAEQFSTSKLQTNDSRKNLILNVFQDNDINNTKNDVSKSKPTVKSVLKISEPVLEKENNLKRKKNVAFSESIDAPNIAKKACTSSQYRVLDNSDKCSNNERKNQSESTINANDTRKQLVVNLLKSPTHKSSRAPMKQAVIRKFPGPAGLLPDNINESEVINVDSLEENKNNNNMYNKTDVCSQNTKNLFTAGAWQMMLDDLPADFELYDIATIKKNALEYNKSYKKVPYFAGIVHYIDYKPNDPHVILKDFSGKIDAHIHYTISKLYPNALGTNIVILLKDVGLIVTSKKYVCLIINPKNLISIYSDEARLVETDHLKNLMGNSRNLHESQISIIEEIENQENKNCNTEFTSGSSNEISSKNKLNINASIHQDIKDKKSTETVNIINEESNFTKKTKVTDHVDDVVDFNFDEDDAWLGVNVEDLNSFKAHQFPSSTPMDINTENLKHENSEQDNENLELSIGKQNKDISKTLKNFVRQKKVKPTLKTSDSPSNYLNIKDLKLNSNNNSNKGLKAKDIENSVNERTDCNQSIGSTTSNENSKNLKKSSNSTKIKLSAFRHKDALTQPLNEEDKESVPLDNSTSQISGDLSKSPALKEQDVNKNKNNIKKFETDSDKQFFCDENDSDDEILSQLDVDAIAASFN